MLALAINFFFSFLASSTRFVEQENGPHQSHIPLVWWTFPPISIAIWSIVRSMNRTAAAATWWPLTMNNTMFYRRIQWNMALKWLSFHRVFNCNRWAIHFWMQTWAPNNGWKSIWSLKCNARFWRFRRKKQKKIQPKKLMKSTVCS